ncbi:MAG: hypothetical protein ACI35W_01565 [Anaeroplasmataceae bacterium]
MKTKNLKGILLGGFAFSAIFTLAACSNSEAGASQFILASNEKLAYSTTTAISMLDSDELMAATSIEEETVDTTTDNSTEYLPEIIEQADLIITNDANFSFVSIESDREDYLNLNIISFNDYEGATHTFKLYYNDVTEKVDTDDDEVETKISYTGLVVYNEMEYSFKFESKTEVEEDESEVKTKLVIYTGENSYISIKNECETEEDEIEEKFTYKVVENNETVVSYSISTEIENGETKVKVKINGETIKLEETIKDDKHYISFKDGKYEAFFERVKDENGKHKHQLVENIEGLFSETEIPADMPSYEDMKNHFEEHFKNFEEMFNDMNKKPEENPDADEVPEVEEDIENNDDVVVEDTELDTTTEDANQEVTE